MKRTRKDTRTVAQVARSVAAMRKRVATIVKRYEKSLAQ